MGHLVILARLYEATLLGVAVFAAFCYRKVDKSTRYIFFWIWLGLLTETFGKLSVALFDTNMPVYGISCLFEFVILCSYFNESIPSLKKKHIGFIIAATGVLLGLLNICFLQPLKGLNSNFLFLECLTIVCLSLYALYRKFSDPDLAIWKETHFCFACLLLFYECSLLWNWGIYDYIVQVHPEKSIILNISLITGNILTYVTCGFLIYRYPKMYQSYV